jgi:hypothetical protein
MGQGRFGYGIKEGGNTCSVGLELEYQEICML